MRAPERTFEGYVFDLTGATTLEEALRTADRPDYVLGDLAELPPRNARSSNAAPANEET